MPEYLSPGVYIEELPGPQSIQGVGTSTTAMVGVTKKGPTEGKPRLVTSFAEFVTQFGGPFKLGPGVDDVTPAMVADWVFGSGKGGRWWLVPYAVQGFFDNGGQRLFFKRVTAAAAAPAQTELAPVGIGQIDDDGRFGDAAPSAPVPGAAATMRLTIAASSAGKWGDGIKVQVVPALSRRLTIDGARLTAETEARVEKAATTVPLTFQAVPAAGRVVAKIGNELHVADLSPTGINLTESSLLRAYDAGTVVELRAKLTVDAAAPELNIRGFGSDVPGQSTAEPVYENALVLLRPATSKLGRLGDNHRFLVAGWNGGPGSVTLKAPIPGGPLPAPIEVFTGDELILVEPRIEIEYTDQETQTLQSEVFGPLHLLDTKNDPDARLDVVASERSALVNVVRQNDLRAGVHWGSFPGTGTNGSQLSGGDDLLSQLDAAAFVGSDGGSGRRTGIKSFEDVDEIAICAAPGIWALEVHNELIRHCEELKDRFAILDPADRLSVQEVMAFREPLDSSYAALYHPWVQVREPRSRKPIDVPPSGHLAGIYGRSDTERGVHKAPANEVVRSIIGLADDINKREQDLLNPLGINALREFPNRGPRVWGGRTLSSISEWRYINVRRLFIFIEESIDEGTQWVVFEPNAPDLWARVRQTVGRFLETLWRTGALIGATRDEAYYVICGYPQTMSQDDLDNGRLIVEVGIAPVKPAEFVIFRFRQKTLEQRPVA